MIWMAAANIVSAVFGAILFIYLARALMPEGFGYLSYALAIIFFIANFVDFGLSTYGAREIAKDKSRVSEYASEIVSLRFIMAAVLTILFVVATMFLPLSGQMKLLLAGSSLLLFRVGLSAEWAFQGIEDMGMVFAALATTSIMQFVLVCAFVKRPEDLLRAPVLYFVATLPVTFIFLKKLKFRLMLKGADMKRITAHLSGSLVIWSISIFAQVYNGFDIFMLGLFRRMDEVGCFTIARRVIGEAALLMIFLANAILPRLSSSFGRDPSEFARTTRKFLKLAIILTLFGVLPFAVFSKPIISLTVGSEYVSASLPLNIMSVGLVLVLFNLPYSTGLVAGGLEKEVLKQAAGCAALSVILNFILMPIYGMIGGAVSFVLVEAMAFIWILQAYNRNIKFDERRQ